MELHREEKREEGDRGEQEEERGNQRREIDLGSALLPKCSLQPGTLRDSQSWVEKRRGREEVEVTWGRKRRVKMGERVIKPIITLLSKNGY